jgi:sulfopyruvate decarboxylase alpha subunit
MDWSATLAQAILANGYSTIAYVPDEVADSVVQLLHRNGTLTMVSATREEEAVGVLAGAFLGGKRGVLLCQGSGIGNSVNALCGLAIGYQIPFLMVISERGVLGEFNPVQTPLGRALPKIFDALGVQAFWLDDAGAIGDVVEGATKLAFSSSMPVAVVLPTMLTGGKTFR